MSGTSLYTFQWKRNMEQGIIKDQYPGLRTEYVTPHVCKNCLAHIADDWVVCPECGAPTGMDMRNPPPPEQHKKSCDKCRKYRPSDDFKSLVCTEGLPAEKAEQCEHFASRYITYPIQVDRIEVKQVTHLHKPCLVRIRPCNCDKTFLGFLCGDMGDSPMASYSDKERTLQISIMQNPAIFVPELMRVVWGYESWWAPIRSQEELSEITDDIIQAQWYVQLAKRLLDKADCEQNVEAR